MKKKRVLSLILALCLSLAFVPMSALAAEKSAVEILLDGIEYYGDRSKCKMDAAMARAYADAIEEYDTNVRGDTTVEFESTISAALVDVAGDGYPLLCIGDLYMEFVDEFWIQSQGSYFEAGSWGDIVLYTYQTGKACRYDFGADQTYLSNSVYPYLQNEYVLWGVELSVNTWNGEPMLCSGGYGDGGDIPDYTGYVLYRVSHAQLTPVHTVVVHTENWDDSVKYVDGMYVYDDASDAGKLDWRYEYSIQRSYSPATALELSTLRAGAMVSALRAYAAALEGNSQGILAQILYYGDRSKCRLTAEQAEAMAAVLENWKQLDEESLEIFCSAYLVDGDDSGYPVLVVFSQWYEYYASTFHPVRDFITPYVWMNGEYTVADTHLLLANLRLGTDYLSVYGHNFCAFGRFSDGTYGWSWNWIRQGSYNSQSFHLKNGTLVSGDYYEGEVLPFTLSLNKNGEPIKETLDRDSSISEEQWSEYTDEYDSAFWALTADEEIKEPEDYSKGGGREAVSFLLRAYAAELAQGQPTPKTAYPSTQTVLVDGAPVTFHAYALKDASGNDTNYIKLRDVADILNGSAAQFEVGWDGSITITTKTAYTPNGSENIANFSGNQSYTVNTSPVKVNGADAALDAITLTDSTGGGYTYFKLRDLGAALGFNVSWDAANGISINSTQPYDPSN